MVALVSGIQMGAFDPRGLTSSFLSESCGRRRTSGYLVHTACRRTESAVGVPSAEGIIKEVGREEDRDIFPVLSILGLNTFENPLVPNYLQKMLTILR